jgi:hypothetical protein
MAMSRDEIVELLRHLGYTDAADEAARVLPDPVTMEQIEEFGAEHGLSRGDLADRMGGSP